MAVRSPAVGSSELTRQRSKLGATAYCPLPTAYCSSWRCKQMFCPKCATQNGDDARFCRSCGTDIGLVPQALSGALAERLAASEDDTRHGRRRRHRGDKPPSI